MSDSQLPCSADIAMEGRRDAIVQAIHAHVGIRQRVNVDLTGVEDAADAILRIPDEPQAAPVTDKALGELLAKICSHEAVDEAMQDAWNDICSDTGCHPLDIEHGNGKNLTFSPNHWANQVAKRLFVRALKLRLETSSQVSRPHREPEGGT